MPAMNTEKIQIATLIRSLARKVPVSTRAGRYVFCICVSLCAGIKLVTFKRHFPKSYRRLADYISVPSRQGAHCRTTNPTVPPVGAAR